MKFPLQRFVLSVASASALFACICFAHADSPSFSDVPAKSPDFAAVEYLKAQGIMQGYSDGTFGPDKPVTRAEAVKILVSTKLSASDIAAFTQDTFTDVPADAWYRPYVEATFSKLGIIQGPPKTTTFNGDKTITRAAFLKLLFASQGADTNAFSEIILPLSSDVTDSTTWFYPVMRYAISSSVLQVSSDGALHPDVALTRGELADEMYLFAMYQQGKRTQALLSEEESELVNVFQMLQNKDILDAVQASARALIASRGALQSRPSTPIVQAAVKIAEGFNSIVHAYDSGSKGNYADALVTAKNAWNSAQKAQQISPSLQDLASRVQVIAKQLADQARAMLGASSSSAAK